MSNTSETNRNPAAKRFNIFIFDGPWPARLKKSGLFLATCALLSGCASTGSLGNKKLEASALAQLESVAGDLAPLIQPAALASGNPAAAKAAGALTKLSSFKKAEGPSVPEGYLVKWDSFLEGKLIDESKIVRKPRLVPVSETAVLKDQVSPATVTDATNEVHQSLSDAVRGL